MKNIKHPEIAKRLADLIAKNDTNMTELATYVGISPQAVKQWVDGSTSAKGENLQKAAKFLKTTEAFIQFGTPATAQHPDGALIVKSDNMSEHIHTIPLLNAHGSMGGGVYPDATEYAIAEIDVTETWLRQTLPTITAPANLRLMTGLGDSMTPTYRNGDTLFVDTGVKAIEIDGVFVFEYKDVVYIKRVQRIPDGLKVISDNKQYDPFVIERVNFPEMMVYGRVHGALEYKGF